MKETMQYKLLDSGHGQRLEDFGGITTIRPAPWASWKPKLSAKDWAGADAQFLKDSSKEGAWIFSQKLPEAWKIGFHELIFELKFTLNGQVGIFPEQKANWEYIKNKIRKASKPISVFNGFAYTGASTLYAASENAEVCHVDASKTSVNWAKENAVHSGLGEKKIRWIVDDVITFMQREKKRGKKYDAIILDPPAFGRGYGGKTWKWERDIEILIRLTGDLLSDSPLFVLFSSHHPDLSPSDFVFLLKKFLRKKGDYSSYNLIIPSADGASLDCGITALCNF
ncbi:MAG: class I SAM-dependent methyltransferase [Candidatus Brocadiae bacterium]|nr:class I SAM-dependent methyltransferase [Candidatus Brocadiia bacterium]